MKRSSGASGFSGVRLHVSNRRQRAGVVGGGLASGVTVWYKADAITGHADASTLSSWPDSGPNARTLTTGGATPPTYYSSTVGQTLNGKPTVSFSGSNQWMQTVAATWGATLDLFIVAKFNGTASSPFMVNIASMLSLWINGTTLSITGNLNTAGSGTADLNWHVWTVRVAPGTNTSYLRIDGTQKFTGSNLANNNTTSNNLHLASVGAGSYMNGQVAEMGLYSQSSLSLVQTQANEAYLKAKWGTP